MIPPMDPRRVSIDEMLREIKIRQLKSFNESQHPRVPAGNAEGGQFTADAASIAKAEEGVRAILNQGGDPKVYRQSLATHYGISLENVDEIIARSGKPRIVSDAVVADERLAEERRLRRTNREGWRRWNHEED